MAETKYKIHEASDGTDIYLVVPDGKKISASHTSSTVTVTFPSGTYIGVGTAVGNSSVHFDYNYCAYVTVVFDTGVSKPASVQSDAQLNKMLASSGSIDNSSYYPNKSSFTAFSNNVILFHKGLGADANGNDYGDQYNWSHSLDTSKKITVDIPSGADDYEVYINGCSMNTTTYRRYAYDPYYNATHTVGNGYGEDPNTWTIPTWMNTNMGTGLSYLGGNSCTHTHTHTENAAENQIWEELSGGSIKSIKDNGDNTITITGTRVTAGTGNKIKSSTLSYDFGSGTDPAPQNLGTASNTDFTYTISIPSDVTSSTVTLKVTLNAKPTKTKGIEITREKSADPVINRYTFPTPPTKIWINTGKASQYTDNIKSSLSAINSGTDQLTANNACKPRKKEILMWKWDGATKGGGAAAIDGFRVYIHKIAKGTTGSPATKTPGNTINLSGETLTLYEIEDEGKSTEALDTYTSTETSKGSTVTYGYYCDIPYDSEESNDAQFGFIPKDLGFSAGDLCYCEVFTYNTWGDGNRRYSKNSATDTDYVPIIGSCNIFNGATVWVRVPKSSTDSTLVWKEGTVYVYHDGEWKEAEGVYVRNGGKWKEST